MHQIDILQPVTVTRLQCRALARAMSRYSSVSRLRHVGSYNCRQMRTAQGENSGWSSHATADAIDIIGVQLSDGRSLTLLSDWGDNDPEAEFLRRIWRGGCDWFRVVLGPDFNRLHADHFHLQGPGWGYCR